jgi:hypothetical protein
LKNYNPELQILMFNNTMGNMSNLHSSNKQQTFAMVAQLIKNQVIKQQHLFQLVSDLGTNYKIIVTFLESAYGYHGH